MNRKSRPYQRMSPADKAWRDNLCTLARTHLHHMPTVAFQKWHGYRANPSASLTRRLAELRAQGVPREAIAVYAIASVEESLDAIDAGRAA